MLRAERRACRGVGRSRAAVVAAVREDCKGQSALLLHVAESLYSCGFSLRGSHAHDLFVAAAIAATCRWPCPPPRPPCPGPPRAVFAGGTAGCPMRRSCSACSRRWSTSMPPRWCRTTIRCSTIRSSAASSACRGKQPEQMQRSLGSGVMVDPSGLVVTNVHVIEGADQVKVSLSDKREFEAEIVLKDTPQRSRGVAAEGRQREIPDARFRQFR